MKPRKRSSTVDGMSALSITTTTSKLTRVLHHANSSNDAAAFVAAQTAPAAIDTPKLRVEVTSLKPAKSASPKRGASFNVELIPAPRPIELLGERRDGHILDPETAEQIRVHLPALQRESCKWELVYSLMEDGASLGTLFRKMAGRSNCVVAICDSQGSVFGGFASDPFAPQKGSFGTGSSFLWRKHNEHTTRVYLSTGVNEMYQLASDSFVAMGLGEDNDYGLFLDHELDQGVSRMCPTYSNEVLASGTQFRCVSLEIWQPGF
ncbi:hypothetical protein SeMB42_g01919 [Synchytrium endobioticum]|uniref:Oxidation resistance protein 1 n=1 Tax=Synchytrium endobioticum TaxID=286115 RepID=A0A507DIL2_9FUNG|nr:hypothetical protein SeLEV6574_g01927 [Synchytrium endobioticum]TPX51423.1 hypothetical protein SeMB42_g01919 [Synchytrium endobioticum]